MQPHNEDALARANRALTARRLNQVWLMGNKILQSQNVKFVYVSWFGGRVLPRKKWKLFLKWRVKIPSLQFIIIWKLRGSQAKVWV